MRNTPEPSHYVGAAIMSGGALVGLASIGVDIDPEPAGLEDVKALAERITQRAYDEGDLPRGQRYMVLSWQRFGATRPLPRSTEAVGLCARRADHHLMAKCGGCPYTRLLDHQDDTGSKPRVGCARCGQPLVDDNCPDVCPCGGAS